MARFDFLKSYIYEAEDDSASAGKHSFYKLAVEDITEAEQRLKSKFPPELRAFYSEVGYGFMCNATVDMFDRLMDPASVVDFQLCEGIYDINEPEEYYGKNFLTFFEVSEVSFIAMDISNQNPMGQCPIYYFESKIADSLEEFIRKMDENADYYLEYSSEN